MTAQSFLKDQMQYFAGHGWSVHLATSPGQDYDRLVSDFDSWDSITLHPVSMTRNPHPLRDFASLASWLALTHRVSPDVVMTGTPKAGLLGMLAARVLGVPHRVYLARGLRLEGLRGVSRVISKAAEQVTCFAASGVVCVSPSLRDAFLANRLAPPTKVSVLGHGSSNGVDTERFRPPSPTERDEARRTLGLRPEQQVVGFAGRLTEDKGVHELIAAFRDLAGGWPNAVLAIAGEQDEASPVSVAPESEDARILMLGAVSDMTNFYRALDVFCLPSRREGFPNVSLEAAATGLPVVTTDATGCRDSVLDGITGRVVPTGDAGALSRALHALLDAPAVRESMGRSARRWSVENFDQELVWRNTLAYIDALVDVRPEAPGGANSRRQDSLDSEQPCAASS
jgi:glycosyltransferase involved in cell wall biosynthesis